MRNALQSARAVGPRRLPHETSLDDHARPGSRGWRSTVSPLHTGAAIAIFNCAVPSRCGAFAYERRIVGGDEGGAQEQRTAKASSRDR
jgi:hypothetical protein